MAPSAIGLNGGGNKKSELLNLSGEPTEKLLDLIYDAAFENDLWRNVLTAIADLTHSQGGILFGQSLLGAKSISISTAAWTRTAIAPIRNDTCKTRGRRGWNTSRSDGS